MKTMSSLQKVLVFSLIGLMIAGTAAFAGPGMGKGSGAGMGMKSGDCPMVGGMGNLTDEQVKKLNDERNAFMTATQDLRQQIMEKEMALKAEMAKKAPDLATATALQKDVSTLEAQFDEKRIAHMIEMKKINPYAGQGMMKKGGMMAGKHGRGCGGGMVPPAPEN
ncbi:MAG: Spy/CpxP family protein refolding chaperone [Desulfatirhabdiaceae bacterium]